MGLYAGTDRSVSIHAVDVYVIARVSEAPGFQPQEEGLVAAAIELARRPAFGPFTLINPSANRTIRVEGMDVSVLARTARSALLEQKQVGFAINGVGLDRRPAFGPFVRLHAGAHRAVAINPIDVDVVARATHATRLEAHHVGLPPDGVELRGRPAIRPALFVDALLPACHLR